MPRLTAGIANAGAIQIFMISSILHGWQRSYHADMDEKIWIVIENSFGMHEASELMVSVILL